ncbi:cache domain-containing sensor histidine kinase [Gordoniibacillus kamchatkensis]|uniref:cache domain-containing sensor histidine kinase n=1 Tax=Gordoniibacillus kamchatkensis TaxID=1590651 RepID=UPI000695FC2A|nr:sensor histidine kinase [Paenibacillus sp. VKM B-2647]
MKRIMAWLKRSLFAKLLVGMLISAVIPYSLSNVISFITTSGSVERKVIQLNQDVMVINMENVKRYLHELNRSSVLFYQDQTLMRYLRSSEVSPSELLYIKNQVDAVYSNRSEFRAVRYISTTLGGQTFFKTNDNTIGGDFRSVGTIPDTENDRWDAEHSYEVAALGKERVLVLHKLLIDYPSPKVIGLVTLYVGLDEIGRLLQSQAGSFSGGAVFLYIRSDNEQLYSSDPSLAPQHPAFAEGAAQGSLDGELNGKKGVFTYVKDDYMGLPLTLVKFIPRAAIDDSAKQTLNRSLVIQIMAVGFVILFAFILSYATISPIRRLLRSIARVETGNFDVNTTTGRKDELGVLESRFQTMVRNIDDLMNREYRNRLELATAQLKMLQAQINPHFLYNTLQSIGTLALRHGAPDINDKIAELGAILRYSMDLKTEIVPLQKELEHIEHYLSLQKGRFKHKLSYAITCPDEALKVPVPKLILQPLVENSIVHGFEKGRGSGPLHIAVGIELDRKLSIRVCDNGKGFDAETIGEIGREYANFELQSGNEGGIGLINVLYRLRLYFGGRFKWEIASKPYEETAIALQIDIDAEEKGGRAD